MPEEDPETLGKELHTELALARDGRGSWRQQRKQHDKLVKLADYVTWHEMNDDDRMSALALGHEKRFDDLRRVNFQQVAWDESGAKHGPSDFEQPADLGFQPFHCDCPACGAGIITVATNENSTTTYLLAFCVFYVLGFYAMLLLPVIWPILKDVYHHCPRCLTVIGVKRNFECPKLNSEVMTFKFGACIIVLLRKYVIAIASVLCVALYLLNAATATADIPILRTALTTLPWDEFFAECSGQAFAINPVHAVRVFDTEFKDTTVKWRGEVLSTSPGFRFIFSAPGYVFIRMHPSGFPHALTADVVLEDTDGVVPANLRKGDVVQFVATPSRLGVRDHGAYMKLWEITPLRNATLRDLDNAAHLVLNRTGDKHWHDHESTRDIDLQQSLHAILDMSHSLEQDAELMASLPRPGAGAAPKRKHRPGEPQAPLKGKPLVDQMRSAADRMGLAEGANSAGPR